jgi:DNA-binding LacI/PurR family transcriptional regulator
VIPIKEGNIMSITMKKIAELAGVNISTVSRALNNDTSISENVKQRILNIADQHNYKRRIALKTNITYMIDKRFFLMSSNFYNRIIESIENEVKKQGFAFHLSFVEPQRFVVTNMNIKNTAGIIITSWQYDKFIQELMMTGIPVVLVDFYQPNKNIVSILSDKIDGVFSAIEYLASLGHRRILYLQGDSTLWGSRDRYIGYKRAIEIFDLEDDDNLVIDCDMSITGAYQAMNKFFDSSRKYPTAIMGANDIVAIGAMEAIKERGLKIPDDISVFGYDDIDLAKEVVPNLSTMRVEKERMGRLAVQQLIYAINNRNPEYDKIIIKPTLVERESTAAPKNS